MNEITMQLVADKYIKMALEEDINSEDISTNAVMPVSSWLSSYNKLYTPENIHRYMYPAFHAMSIVPAVQTLVLKLQTISD